MYILEARNPNFEIPALLTAMLCVVVIKVTKPKAPVPPFLRSLEGSGPWGGSGLGFRV